MQEDTDYDAQAQTPSAPGQVQWYARIWAFCLGYGCLEVQTEQCPKSFIPYVPEEQFQRAASTGDLFTVERLIASRTYHVDNQDSRRRTSLHYACFYNHTDVVKLLIQKNCNINVQDDKGCTPLIKAIEQNNLECVSILMNNGADPHVRDIWGNTALHYAVYTGNKTIVSELLEHKADINAKTEKGFTPFSLAVSEKRLQMAEFLKDKGANVDAMTEPNRGASLEEESKSVLKTSAQINAEVDDSTNHTSPSSKGTSFKEPEQRSKKHNRFNEVVKGRTKRKTSISEAVPLEQMMSAFQTSASEQIRDEVDNNIEQKILSRFSDKPDVTRSMTEGDVITKFRLMDRDRDRDPHSHQSNGLSSQGPVEEQKNLHPATDGDKDKWVSKKTRQSVEMIKHNPECIHEKTSSPFLWLWNKQERRRAKRRFRNLLRRHDEAVCSRREPLQNSSEGQIPMKNVSPDPETKVHDIESVPSGLPPEEKSDDVLMEKESAQGVSPIGKETTKTDVGLSEKNEVNIVPVEEPLPSTPKGKTHYTKITQGEEQTNCDSEYTPVHSRPPSKDSEERWAQLVATQYSFLNQYLRERRKEKMREDTETSSDEEPGHSTSGGRTHSANMFQKQEVRNEYGSEDPPSEHHFAKKSEEEEWAQMSAFQYTCLNELLRKDFKKKIRKLYEKSESTICSNKVPIPDKHKVRTHLKKMTEEKRRHDRKDAQVHSRLSSVKRKEDIKEQADWHHTRWKELLRNDIKEILREELAVEHAKMRKLFRKDVEELMGLLRNELSQICMEQVALLKEQAKETQQEHWNLQYLRLKDLFRRDLKEMVCEHIQNSKIIICPKEPLPGPFKGTTDFQRTALEQEKKKKYEGGHDSAPSHSGKPWVQTDEESVDGQNDSHCMPLKELIKEDLKEKLGEILEKYKYDTCMKKELPHIFKGRKQLRKISTEQKQKKKYDSKSLHSEQPATKTVKKVEHEHGELQYVHRTEAIKKDLKVKICEVLGKYETNVCPKEEALPHVSKKKTRSKVEEKKSGYLSTLHFSSFEHRIAALRATAHVEPAPAAYAGYAVDAAVDQQYLEAMKLISMSKLK